MSPAASMIAPCIGTSDRNSSAWAAGSQGSGRAQDTSAAVASKQAAAGAAMASTTKARELKPSACSCTRRNFQCQNHRAAEPASQMTAASSRSRSEGPASVVSGRIRISTATRSVQTSDRANSSMLKALPSVPASCPSCCGAVFGEASCRCCQAQRAPQPSAVPSEDCQAPSGARLTSPASRPRTEQLAAMSETR